MSKYKILYNKKILNVSCCRPIKRIKALCYPIKQSSNSCVMIENEMKIKEMMLQLKSYQCYTQGSRSNKGLLVYIIVTNI